MATHTPRATSFTVPAPITRNSVKGLTWAMVVRGAKATKGTAAPKDTPAPPTTFSDLPTEIVERILYHVFNPRRQVMKPVLRHYILPNGHHKRGLRIPMIEYVRYTLTAQDELNVITTMTLVCRQWRELLKYVLKLHHEDLWRESQKLEDMADGHYKCRERGGDRTGNPDTTCKTEKGAVGCRIESDKLVRRADAVLMAWTTLRLELGTEEWIPGCN